MRLNDVAVYETRQIQDDSAYWVKQKRGWWAKQDNKFLGSNRSEAEDIYAIRYHIGPTIDWIK